MSLPASPSVLIGADMGGTSSDLAVVPGDVLEQDDGEVGSFPLLIPMLTIETVGAGGGSIARIDAGGGLHVGPESAGAVPGPAAYDSATLVPPGWTANVDQRFNLVLTTA